MKRRHKGKKSKSDSKNWLATPMWWYKQEYVRNVRRKGNEVVKAIVKGQKDEDTLMPVDKKPHIYFW